jgi:hypothetical protein
LQPVKTGLAARAISTAGKKYYFAARDEITQSLMITKHADVAMENIVTTTINNSSRSNAKL